MILIGMGANLPSAAGPPQQTLEAALAALAEAGIVLERRSAWYRSAPLPAGAGDQPWYVNGVIAVATRLTPVELLGVLHRVEARFGRVRRQRNEPRVLDLDLLDHDGALRHETPVLPHPRLQERAFVLLPLADIAPDWRHPASGASLAALIAALPPGQPVERL
ncbi:MAG TPA: 2-amino-4-hydroxy-6-hydroxymethyldihydropteridine diphosphokinase [Stellaceae bacterium]|nr:2-amino-4-hydroxy-6-hydroxymethyldihydropteridine diphosphokinase [Stellaceae bacterium]